MELLLLLGILIAFVGTIVVILYRLWRRGGAWRIASASIIAFITYEVVTAIWPPSSFYFDEFKYRSGISLPNTASVIERDSSYPDFHGDYFSEAVIQLEPKDFEALKSKLTFTEPYKCFTPDMAKRHLINNISPIDCWTIRKEIDDRFDIILFSDGKTVYFQFNQT